MNQTEQSLVWNKLSNKEPGQYLDEWPFINSKTTENNLRPVYQTKQSLLIINRIMLTINH